MPLLVSARAALNPPSTAVLQSTVTVTVILLAGFGDELLEELLDEEPDEEPDEELELLDVVLPDFFERVFEAVFLVVVV